ncbi:alpha/beta hydrolase [Martelella sp. HB161492]|uniref:alpha/beta fold hydrolase n=1 Tax=Martelella sp. HB161492 TaxID=2720726 RepID=UPI0015905D78|nr:alpha/beta hydrolase [Martelella sp. HB161492]
MLWSVNKKAETSAGNVVWGSAGSGPPLVLAHGWPWSSFIWHRVLLSLSHGYSVYWYDMPGYGRSEKKEGQATGIDVQAKVFAEMLAIWDIDRPTVWAHDLSGAVALRAHLLDGVAFTNLILMNCVALSPWGSEFFDHVGRHLDAFRPLPHHIHAAIVEAYIRSALVGEIAETDLHELVLPWMSPEGQVSFYNQFAEADQALTRAFEPKLGDIDCPVTLIWGEKDPWIPLERGRALAAKIGVPLHHLPDAGHLPPLEAPRELLDALIAIPDTLPELKGM